MYSKNCLSHEFKYSEADFNAKSLRGASLSMICTCKPGITCQIFAESVQDVGTGAGAAPLPPLLLRHQHTGRQRSQG